jgi:hypothetical protein
MTLCPNNQKAIIEWQYPGSGKQRIIGADNFNLVDATAKYGTLSTKFYEIRGKAICAARVPPAHITTIPLKYNVGDVVPVRILNSWMGSIYDWKLKPNGVNMDSTVTHTIQDSCSLVSCNCLISTTDATVFTLDGYRCKTSGGSVTEAAIYADSLHDIEAIYTGSQSLPCRNVIPSDCTFQILKNGQVVHQKTDAVCPIVTHTCGEQCPAGSCECSCGTEICCYHPKTGKVVKSFKR